MRYVEAVEGRLVAGMKSFVLAQKQRWKKRLSKRLVAIPPQSVSLDLQEKNIMSVYVPEMHFTVKDETEESDFKYGYLNPTVRLMIL